MLHDIMISKTGKEISILKAKLDLLVDCCLELYKSSNLCQSNIEQFLRDIALTEIMEGQLQRHNLDITYAKFEDVISKMKLGKSSGLDGLPVEFYKIFKEELKPHLIKLVSYWHKEGVLPSSWKEARLVLVPKEGKNHKVPSAYWPLSMLNTDYKIITTILANSLNAITETCVHKGQTGFIQGRYVKTNVRKILDIINKSQVENDQQSCYLWMLKRHLTRLNGSIS